MCPWVMVVSANTGSILVVAVTLVACTTTESWWRSSKYQHSLYRHSHPGFFGKAGQRHFHLQRNQQYKPTINLSKLWTLVPESARKSSTSAHAAVINVVKAGYFKVLGSGALPAIPCVVYAKEFSSKAEKRIVAAGGACKLVAWVPNLKWISRGNLVVFVSWSIFQLRCSNLFHYLSHS